LRRYQTGFLAALCILVAGCARPPAITSALNLDMNPSGRTPLAGLLTFTTDQPVRATLTISDGDDSSTVTPSDALSTEHELMVLGLRPGRLNTIEVSIENGRGEAGESGHLEVQTEPLPDYFPPIDVTLSRPARMEPGITLLPLTREINLVSDQEFGLFVALDASGDVLWYYDAGHPVDEARRLPNGNLLYNSRRTRILEIDMLGNIINEWAATAVRDDAPPTAIPVDTDSFHHDVLQMPSGNFLALSTEMRRFESYPSNLEDPNAEPIPANVIGDVLVEFQPDGEIVRRWKGFDHLDPLRLGYGSLDTGFYRRVYGDMLGETGYDWAHGNGIYYEAEADATLVSFNHQSVVVKIDMSSGDILWMLGNPQGWRDRWQALRLEPEGDLDWSWHQHAPELTPNGTLLLFDNGAMQAMPPNPPMLPPETYSRAVEYLIDEAAGTVEEVWSYGGPGEEWFFSGFISEADWLPETENILITSGGRIRKPDGTHGVWPGEGRIWVTIAEVTHSDPAEKVWEVVIDDPAVGWASYRGERLPSLYP